MLPTRTGIPPRLAMKAEIVLHLSSVMSRRGAGVFTRKSSTASGITMQLMRFFPSYRFDYGKASYRPSLNRSKRNWSTIWRCKSRRTGECHPTFLVENYAEAWADEILPIAGSAYERLQFSNVQFEEQES